MISFLFRFNKSLRLNFKKEWIDFILKNSTKITNKDKDYSLLMLALKNNKEENLNLNNEQFEYLIKNSDLNVKDNINKDNVLNYLIKNQNKLSLSYKNMNYIINNTIITKENDLIELNKNTWQ